MLPLGNLSSKHRLWYKGSKMRITDFWQTILTLELLHYKAAQT